MFNKLVATYTGKCPGQCQCRLGRPPPGRAATGPGAGGPTRSPSLRPGLSLTLAASESDSETVTGNLNGSLTQAPDSDSEHEATATGMPVVVGLLYYYRQC